MLTTTNLVDETSWSKLRDVCKQLQRKTVIQKKAAYEDAFSHVYGYIEDRIIGVFQVQK